ncbi:MAG TPA: NUDIX hydrolase [Marmoricola sp.]|nr:NUDIX hydrolase [Marmoricola sp.]
MSGPVDTPESWEVVSSADLFRDDWVMALRADVVRRGGHDFTRLVFEHPGAAVVLAVDDQERAAVITQYRHPGQRRFVELPAGLLDVPGEDPLLTAQRELQEEVGLQADHWEHLISTYASPGIMTEQHVVYLATGLNPIHRGDFVAEHEEAELEMHWVPVVDLVEGVLNGRLTNGGLVVAVLAYAARQSKR